MKQLILRLVEPSSGSYTVDISSPWHIGAEGIDDGPVGSLNTALARIASVPDRSFVRSFPQYTAKLRDKYDSDRPVALYFRLLFPRGTPEDDLDDIKKMLRKEKEIVQRVTTATRIRSQSNQGYVKPRKDRGVDAEFSWQLSLPGNLGQNVRVCLIDDLYDKSHDALDHSRISYVQPPDEAEADAAHGTRCLGVLMGKNAASTFTGIAHGIDHCFISSTSLHEDYVTAPGEEVLAPVTLKALKEVRAFDLSVAWAPLVAGDVLLVPKAAGTEADKELPVEVNEDIWGLFCEAANEGIVVVESAGNSGLPLDDLVNFHNYGNSNAIVVGAGYVSGNGGEPLTRHLDSNYGSRVDCQGWGESVYTTDKDNAYTDDFRLTSGAAAIVAGVVAVVQSMHLDKPGVAIAPSQMRDALRATGQPRPASISGGVGTLPDIRELLRYLMILPDCYLRNHIGDSGLPAPDPGEIPIESPDIIARNEAFQTDPADILGGACWDDTDRFEVPKKGQASWIYLRIQNRGLREDEPVIRLYWTQSGSEMDPSQWQQIGHEEVQLGVSPGVTRVVTKGFSWTPEIDVTDITLIAVVDSEHYRPPGIVGLPWLAGDLAFLLLHRKVAFRKLKKKKNWLGCALLGLCLSCLLLWFLWFSSC